MRREDRNITRCSKLSKMNFKKKNGDKTNDLNKNSKERVQRFHTSLEMNIVQCSVWFEAWPLSASTKSLKASE